MSAGSGVFVLCSDPCDHGLNGYHCYISHGAFRGEQDVVSSGSLGQAKFFFSREEADTFLQTELPLWARRKYRSTEVSEYRLCVAAPERYAKLLQSEKINMRSDSR